MSKLVNQTALTYMALAIPFYFIFDYFNLHLAANVVFFIECLYLLILFANVKGYLTIAKSGMIIAKAVFILPFYSLYLGPLSGAHLVYVPLAILPIILFEDATFKAKLSMVASVIFCGMCFSSAEHGRIAI